MYIGLPQRKVKLGSTLSQKSWSVKYCKYLTFQSLKDFSRIQIPISANLNILGYSLFFEWDHSSFCMETGRLWHTQWNTYCLRWNWKSMSCFGYRALFPNGDIFIKHSLVMNTFVLISVHAWISQLAGFTDK